MRSVKKPFLFEVAWEVANKVGGIYTVIKSKVPVTVQEYSQDRYFLLGPLNARHAQLEVEAMNSNGFDLNGNNRYLTHVHSAIECMRQQGIKITFGRWLIDSSPYVILFDLGSVAHRMNEWKGDLWEKAGIPSPMDDTEMNDAILFGYLVAWFLGEFSHRSHKYAILAHFHEWMASVGLVLCSKRSLDIATIFTTHATLLGRYLCAGSVDFYNHLHLFDVDYEAGRRGIYHRYCLERSAAHCADVFTTVSHVTAYEAENLLKRKPDGVLPNGLNVVKFSAMHEFQNLHALYKERIHDFVRGHFFGHLNFDLGNTLYFFTSGRYEFRNKGVDMFLEALARVNQRLKHINSPITVVAFIIMPAQHHSYTVEALKGQAVMKQLKSTIDGIQQAIGARLVESCAHGLLPKSSELLTEQETVLLKRRLFSMRRDSLPPVVTHNMANDSEDQILSTIRRLGMFNSREDKVKIVFHPEFLNSNNPLFNMEYDDFVRGCHLGVFPSYYEPWGYTPAECTVMGVPSITTNLSGFGCFMEDNIENPPDYGIYIVDRRLKSIEESIQQLSDTMMHFCQKSRRQRINQRNRTERLSDILDWQRMGLEYVKARRLAMRRRYEKSFEGESEIESEWHDDDEILDDSVISSFKGVAPAAANAGGISAPQLTMSSSSGGGSSKKAGGSNDKLDQANSGVKSSTNTGSTIEERESQAGLHHPPAFPSRTSPPTLAVRTLAGQTTEASSPSSSSSRRKSTLKISTETEEFAIESPLQTGKKIQEPLSAPASPKLQAMIAETESGMRELMTGGSGISANSGSTSATTVEGGSTVRSTMFRPGDHSGEVTPQHTADSHDSPSGFSSPGTSNSTSTSPHKHAFTEEGASRVIKKLQQK